MKYQTFYCYSLNRRKTAYTFAGMSIRLSNFLGLSKPSPHLTSNTDTEHRKRVWWTSYCLDRMTSSDSGLESAFHSDSPELEYPDDCQLSHEELQEFSAADYLTAQSKLCSIRRRVDETVSRLRTDDARDPQQILEPSLELLNLWRSGLPMDMSFTFDNGLPQAITELAAMRPLAPLYLRYHQCQILILRPLLLKQLALISQNESSQAYKGNLMAFNSQCMQAARRNIKIMNSLSELKALAKFGFWESLHLFSSIAIFSLVKFINLKLPGSFEFELDDVLIHERARGLLNNMVQAGNLAAKGHVAMLKEMETLEPVTAAGTAPSSSTVDDAVATAFGQEFNINDWADLLC